MKKFVTQGVKKKFNIYMVDTPYRVKKALVNIIENLNVSDK